MTRDDGSVTHWFHLLQQGDHEAAQPLWERYCSRLEELACKTLGGRKFAVADEEDVALSAFDSLCRALQQGRFPRLADRTDLWKVLVVITARKIAHLVRDQHTQKRAGIPVATGGLPDDAAALEQVMGPEPTPEFAAQAMEEYERLLASLKREDLRRVAIRKMEGCTNQEIAGELGCTARTVDRKLRLIRRIWEQGAEP